MSFIIPLITLCAFLYAAVILCIVLVYHTPRIADLIDLSVDFYQLLLAAYPAPFRDEYGEAMVQLFRDTARDAYRRRGLRGLAVMWLRTLSDFTVSVIQQHRDKPVPVSSESVLLHDFLQKWRCLGTDVLSVTVFSAWYSYHLLRLFVRRAVLVWTTFTVLAFGLWFTSFFDSIRLVRWGASEIGICRGGSMVIWHIYLDDGEPVSEEQWQRDRGEWMKRNPSVSVRLRSTARSWEFSFLSDIPEARGLQYTLDGKRLFVRPGKSWQLRFPFGIVPALLLGWTIRVYLRRNRGSVAAMQWP